MKDSHRQRGSASLEAVIAAPAFVLFLGLIVFGGRTAVANQTVESAASDAARSASLVRTAPAAQDDAVAAAKASLRNQGVNCREMKIKVDDAGFARAPGRVAEVAVTVECVLDLSDLSVPGVPGSRTISATARSPLDTWRERS